MDDEALDVHEGATSAPGHIREFLAFNLLRCTI